MDEVSRAVVEEWTIGADLVVQGLVTEEMRGEIEGRPYQDICLSVDDVLRGSGATSGVGFVTRWMPPPRLDDLEDGQPPPSGVFHIGRHYVLFLEREPCYPQGQGVAPWCAQLNFLIDRTANPSDRPATPASSVIVLDSEPPSEAAVDWLIAAILTTPHPEEAVSRQLERFGLYRAGSISAWHAFVPKYPDVPGTLLPESSASEPSFPWPEKFSRIRAAARQAEFGLDRWGGNTLYLITVPVSNRPGVIDYNVVARFLTTDTEVAAGWLEPYGHVFGLQDLAAALEVHRQQTQGFYPPVSNRAGLTVNLAKWFGAEEVAEVTATFVPKDRRFLPADSASAILASLDGDSQTTNLAAEADVLGSDCSKVDIGFKRRDGYSFRLTYDMRDNRLYSFEDGFSVEAPAHVPEALGVVPFITGQCPLPPPKPGT